MTLIDIAEATAARDEGIARADQGADRDWKWHARQAVYRTAQVLPEFTVDSVQLRMPVAVTTQDGRAMGAVMRQAALDGWIEATDRVKPGTQVKSHRNPRRIWKSRIFKGAA